MVMVLLAMGCRWAVAQSALDSLEQKLPSLSGKDKIAAAGELAYGYCYVNADKAIEYGQLELQLAEEEGDSLLIAQAWNDLSAAHAVKGGFEESMRYATDAVRVRRKYGDSLQVASSLNRIGYAALQAGRHDRALEAFLGAAAIYEQQSKQMYLDVMYNNIGSVYLKLGNDDKAKDYLQRSLDMAKGNRNTATQITAETNLAGIYFENGDYPRSEGLYRELLQLIDSSGTKENLSTVLMNLGVCLTYTGSYDSAMVYLQQALTIYLEKGDQKGEGMVRVNMGSCLTGMGKFDEAEGYLKRGMQLCELTGSDMQLFYALDALSRLEIARGNYGKAMDYAKQANNHRERMFNKEAAGKIAEMETRFETAKKEKDLATATLKNRNQQLLILGLSGLLLLLVTVTLFGLRQQRLRRTQLLQQSQLDLQEERLRISRDLHDHIGAELTLISTSLDERAKQTQADAERKALEVISGMSRNAMGQLRETIWAIRTESISVSAFALRLSGFAERVARPKGMQILFSESGTGEMQLSPMQTIQLFRASQEAIHNAVKYSGASTLKITVEGKTHGPSGASSVSIEIADAGLGFDPASASAGYGIQNMQARMEEAGGSFALTASPGHGTTVTLTLPV
jgi:signal transduction histidine kinase